MAAGKVITSWRGGVFGGSQIHKTLTQPSQQLSKNGLLKRYLKLEIKKRDGGEEISKSTNFDISRNTRPKMAACSNRGKPDVVE